MRRTLADLAPSTIASYRHKARKLWLRVESGQGTEADRLELRELEDLLGLRGSEVPGPGRPRKYRDAERERSGQAAVEMP